MFSLSFWEVSLIICIAVIILKPEDIPVIAKQVGKFIKSIKSYFSEFTEMFDDSGKPKTKPLIADDGLEYEAYDIEEVMADVVKEEEVKKKPQKKSKAKPKKATNKKPTSKKKLSAKPKNKTNSGKANK